jgi:hypothetical protein
MKADGTEEVEIVIERRIFAPGISSLLFTLFVVSRIECRLAIQIYVVNMVLSNLLRRSAMKHEDELANQSSFHAQQ